MDRLNWVAGFVQANRTMLRMRPQFYLGRCSEIRFIDHIYIVRRLSMNRLKQERDERGAWKWMMIV